MTETTRTPKDFINDELILESLRRIEERLDQTTVSEPEVQRQNLNCGSAFRQVRATLRKRQGGIR